MTLYTDSGLDVVINSLVGDVSGILDAVAVGSGSGSEQASATALTNEVFRANTGNSNLRIETGDSGGKVLVINLKGGTDVSSGTEITEIGAFFDGAGGGGTLVVVDEFPGITVEAGVVEQFTLPLSLRRPA